MLMVCPLGPCAFNVEFCHLSLGGFSLISATHLPMVSMSPLPEGCFHSQTFGSRQNRVQITDYRMASTFSY